MKFRLLPILDTMEKLYRMPRTNARFEEYLFLLQGKEKTDMVLPIGGYNPMGNENVLNKILELQTLGAEQIIIESLHSINDIIENKRDHQIQVVINLADDIGGAWANYYVTDYKSKFEIGALIKRQFCIPNFFTSEIYSAQVIIDRVCAYVFRTIYWIEHGVPSNLNDHILQEIFVQTNLAKINKNYSAKTFKTNNDQFKKYAFSDDYSVIFNYFYGDEASRSLGYKVYHFEQ